MKKEKGFIQGFAPVTADKIAVWSETHRQELLSVGVPDEKIVVTGRIEEDTLNERHEAILKRKKSVFDIFRKRIPEKTRKQRVLVIGEMGFRTLIMLEAFVGLDNVEIILRPHHNMSDHFLRKAKKFIKENNIKAIIDRNIDYVEQFVACDYAIANCSTMINDAIFLRKPIINCLFSSDIEEIQFARTLPVVTVKTVEKLRELIVSPLKHKQAYYARLNEYQKEYEKQERRLEKRQRK